MEEIANMTQTEQLALWILLGGGLSYFIFYILAFFRRWYAWIFQGIGVASAISAFILVEGEMADFWMAVPPLVVMVVGVLSWWAYYHQSDDLGVLDAEETLKPKEAFWLKGYPKIAKWITGIIILSLAIWAGLSGEDNVERHSAYLGGGFVLLIWGAGVSFLAFRYRAGWVFLAILDGLLMVTGMVLQFFFVGIPFLILLIISIYSYRKSKDYMSST